VVTCSGDREEKYSNVAKLLRSQEACVLISFTFFVCLLLFFSLHFPDCLERIPFSENASLDGFLGRVRGKLS
jgi:hypothetical protein